MLTLHAAEMATPVADGSPSRAANLPPMSRLQRPTRMRCRMFASRSPERTASNRKLLPTRLKECACDAEPNCNCKAMFPTAAIPSKKYEHCFVTEQEGAPSWQETRRHTKKEPNCKKWVTREGRRVTLWSVRAKVDGAEKDHAARSTAQAGLRVGERCRQSFRAKLSLTSGLKVRVSRMSKRSTQVKDCEREHTKDWTRKARTVRLDVAVALFVSSNAPTIQHLLIHPMLCVTDLGPRMMHASKSMYLALFFAKTFLSFFLDVCPVMLNETI